MPVIRRNDYQPPFWLPNGHFQSIYPALFRKTEGKLYTRERLVTEDGDFLDLDWSYQSGAAAMVASPLVILSHGLEGSTSSQYIRGMVKLLTANGFDCLSWNFRGCSGEMNQTLRFYHSGATEDLDAVVQRAIQLGYTDIRLMGFSLGGNLTLKYVGERGEGLSPEVKSALVFSVPMDLRACCMALIQPRNRVYMNRFLKSLKLKIEQKAPFFPQEIKLEDYRFVKNLYDFDHIYTAGLHGFASADDYYARCSSMHFVEGITVPTLIVIAENDPMVPFSTLPVDAIRSLSKVSLEHLPHGGHCGFRPASLQNGTYWSELRALEFLSQANPAFTGQE